MSQLPQRDVWTALGSIVTGAGAGTAIISVTLIALRLIQPEVPTSDPTTGRAQLPPGAQLLGFGTILSLTVAVLLAFHRAHGLAGRWQRFAISALAAFATTFLAVLTMPIDRTLGVIGLTGMFGLALVMTVTGWRWTRTPDAESHAEDT